MGSVQDEPGRVEALGMLCRFRQEFYDCLVRSADALFEVTDAVLCTDGPVRTLVDLTLAPENRRGHGALYDGLNCGRLANPSSGVAQQQGPSRPQNRRPTPSRRLRGSGRRQLTAPQRRSPPYVIAKNMTARRSPRDMT